MGGITIKSSMEFCGQKTLHREKEKIKILC
jgi:hypothetical protein